MSSGGFSKTRLADLRGVLSAHVERGAAPGLVALVYRRGETIVEVLGKKAFDDASSTMERDTIFRITSMTKPVTAVAAMILVEECKLRLDDPVDRWLPELADRRVLVRPDAPLEDTVPAQRAITLRDLLTFRTGFGMILAPNSKYPILKAARELELMIGPPKPRTPHGPDEWMRRFGTLPLMYQPGERWLYNTSYDLLGVLIARVSGKPLETFFRERIFDPLGMSDTGFSVPAEKRPRLATAYQPDSKSDALLLHDGVEDGQWSTPPPFPAGRDGLVSTVDDYLAFGRMMLDKGTFGGERILSRPTIEAMITDQLTDAQKISGADFLGNNRGWGFGVAMILRRDDIASVPGRFGWDGGFGTSWSSDPAEHMLGILLTQRVMYPKPAGIELDFWTSAYRAIE